MEHRLKLFFFLILIGYITMLLIISHVCMLISNNNLHLLIEILNLEMLKLNPKFLVDEML